MQQVLFLCTANYYRSRFSEQYFNHHARQRGLAWQADSRAIARDPVALGAIGPMSEHSIKYLSQLGLVADESRGPIPVQDEHFDQFTRVIAASRDEHYPMMQELFPHRADSIDYFTVEDLHIYGPERALPHLVQCLDALLEELRLAG